LEDKAMDLALEDMFEETGRRWEPWASNGKSVRVGTIVLLVNSDTSSRRIVLGMLHVSGGCDFSARVG